MVVPQHATSIRTLPIHWSTQRAEWQSHLWRAEAEGRYKTSGERWSIDDGFFRRALVAADGEPAGVELCYVPVDDEHVMTFLLSQSTILPEIVEEVNSWIDNATRQIGSEPAQFDWFAVIGARDLPWIAHPFALGHLRLHPRPDFLRGFCVMAS